MLKYRLMKLNDMKQTKKIFSTIPPVIDDSKLVAALSDFAILTGAMCTNNTVCTPFMSRELNAGHYYLDSTLKDNQVNYIDGYGNKKISSQLCAYIGIRPVIEYDHIKDLTSFNPNALVIHDNTLVSYGYYPQYVVFNDKNLDQLLNAGKLEETIYSYYYNYCDAYDDIIFRKNSVYKKDNSFYMPFLNEHDKDVRLSNGELLTKKKYWLKVEPVRWYHDKNKKILVCTNILQSGIYYNKASEVYSIDDFRIYRNAMQYFLYDYFVGSLENMAKNGEYIKEDNVVSHFNIDSNDLDNIRSFIEKIKEVRGINNYSMSSDLFVLMNKIGIVADYYNKNENNLLNEDKKIKNELLDSLAVILGMLDKCDVDLTNEIIEEEKKLIRKP